MIFERGFDGRDKIGIDFDAGGQQAAHAGGINIRVVEAAEHALRSGGEAFAFLQQLLEDFEA